MRRGDRKGRLSDIARNRYFVGLVQVMEPASRTPEGESNRCPIYGNEVRIEPSRPPGDAPCPCCGHLLWFSSPRSLAAVVLSQYELQERFFPAWVQQFERCPDERYFKELVSGLAKLIAATRGAAWIVERMRLARVFQYEEAEFPETPAERRRSDDLLRRVAATRQSLVSRPSAEAELRGDRPCRNSCVLLAVPVRLKGMVLAIIEIAQEPGGSVETEKSNLRFLEQIATLASLRIGRLRVADLTCDASLDLEEAMTVPVAVAGGKKRWWQVWKK
jgi:hypothetical protein